MQLFNFNISKHLHDLNKKNRENFSRIKHRGLFYLQRGLTLIELLVSIAIIGILASIATPAYQDYQSNIKTTQAIADIQNIEHLLERYYFSNNKFPPSLAEVGADNMRDPWGNPYQYLNLSDPNIKGTTGKARKDHNLVPINSDFDLYSMGKDGKSVSPLTAAASRDDIVRANNGRYIGLASKY